MNTAGKGRRCEAKSRRWLESQGYVCIRSAASKGLFDLVAISTDHVLLVQIKSGRWPSNDDQAAIRRFPCPDKCKKFLHRWRLRQAAPDIREVL